MCVNRGLYMGRTWNYNKNTSHREYNKNVTVVIYQKIYLSKPSQ